MSDATIRIGPPPPLSQPTKADAIDDMSKQHWGSISTGLYTSPVGMLDVLLIRWAALRLTPTPATECRIFVHTHIRLSL